MPIFWSDSWTMYNLKRVRWCVDLIEMWEVSLPWGQVNRLGVGVMSHIIFMGLGEPEVGALNSYEGKGGASLKKGAGNRSLWRELTTQLFYMNYLPISASFGIKSFMICTT